MEGKEGQVESKTDRASDCRKNKDEIVADEEETSMEFLLRFAEHMDTEEFHSKMVDFFKDNCHIVDLTTDEESHEYFELYKQYQVLVEETLQDFVDREGMTCAQLYERLRHSNEENEFASEYIQYCIDCLEYHAFAKTLREYWTSFAQTHNLLDQPAETKNHK